MKITFQELKGQVQDQYQHQVNIKEWYLNERKRHGWPSKPYRCYPEWRGWRDFVGKIMKFLTYRELQALVTQLITENARDVSLWYREERVKHEGWPSNPRSFYPEWEGWTQLAGRTGREFLTYHEWLEQVYPMLPKSGFIEWYSDEWCKHPGWPCTPYFYPEFKGWRDLNSPYLSYQELQAEVRALYQPDTGIVSWYRSEYQLHRGWPSDPPNFYPEWKNWMDFVGLQRNQRSVTKFLTLPQLVKEIQQFSITTGLSSWYRLEYVNHPNWPNYPPSHYKEWQGWDSLLPSSANVQVPKIPYTKFLEEVISCDLPFLGLKKWYAKERLVHPGWPDNPIKYYPECKGWTSFKTPYLTYPQLRAEVARLIPPDISVQLWYKLEYKKHTLWPSSPNLRYKEWVNWHDLASRETPKFLTYSELQIEVQKLWPGGARSTWYSKEYKKHPGWPSSPQTFYQEWKGWLVFLTKPDVDEMTNLCDEASQAKKYLIWCAIMG